MSVCGAKTRKPGSPPCKNAAVTGSTRCRMHGGKTPRGAALPQTTHGRYSKDLPTRLGERFLAAQSDRDLLNLNAEIALLDARAGELLQRVDIDGAGTLWRSLGGIVADLEAFLEEEDMEGMEQGVRRLKEIVRRARDDAEAWNQIYPLVEQRRKLVESEGKRRKDMQDMITSEKAMLLVTSLVETVRRHVHDRDTLAAISADLARLLEHDAG
jgi:hypothetical protein